MKKDIEIAQNASIEHIAEIAKKINIMPEDIDQYGKYKAKVNNVAKYETEDKGKVILVTAINPTPAGEGKTTTTIGLTDALNRLGKKAIVALREPSLGPVFGIKGGATGGGYSQVLPMEDINLHFTGDIHAIGAANNLLAAMLDNHIHHGNALGIDVRRIFWRRAVDMNDRQLRNMVSGLGGTTQGVPRESRFDITVASEVMAAFCLANDLTDLKDRLSKIILAYNREGKVVTAADLKAEGAMTALLKEAIKPNLVQTLEGNPALIHGGPFANIAHGCNSVIATNLARNLGDYVVTEAGFGADLGAEKFLNIKCRQAGIKPDAVVIVATVRALKYSGGLAKDDLNYEDMEALIKGIPNLMKHIENIKGAFGLPVTVAINKFPFDTEKEVNYIKMSCLEVGVRAIESGVWEKGGEGGIELAEEVLNLIENGENNFNFLYDINMSIPEKIEKICKEIYGAGNVHFSRKALREIKNIEALGLNHLPVCMAKTQYSLSDNPKLIGRPIGFEVNIRNITVSAGAGFVVAMTGEIMKMPGLPKVPSAEKIDIDANGKISGLF